jgi:hypothetical protein
MASASGTRSLRRAWFLALGGTMFSALFILLCPTLLTWKAASGS